MSNSAGHEDCGGPPPAEMVAPLGSLEQTAIGPGGDDGPSDGFYSLILSGMALVHYGMFYGIGVLLAHWLGASAYGDYCVAVATVTLAAALGTLGMEKYTLKVLPAMQARGAWSEMRGYWRVSQSVVLAASAAIMLVVLDIEALFSDGLARHAEARALLFLPAVGMVLLMLEIATAYRTYLLATFIYRVLLPLLLLGLLVSWSHISWPVTASQAACCYGAAWVLTFIAMRWAARRSTPRELWRSPAAYHVRAWIGGSIPFLLQSLLMTLLVQAGVIVLEIVRPHDPEVAVYGAALQTGAVIVLAATSTNRFYLPQLSMMLEKGDAASLRRRGRSRYLVMALLCGPFLIVCLLFGRSILGWYGPSFRDGYLALCVLAAASSLTTMLALAPHYLQFVGRHRWVLGTTASAAAANIGLCVALAPRHGALGAAVAYALSLTGMYLTCLLLMHWDMRRFGRPAGR